MMKSCLLLAGTAAALFWAGTASAEDAKAYCWVSEKNYHFCYGPIQRTLVGTEAVSEPLKLVGCSGAKLASPFSGKGVRRGGWYACTERSLKSYDNSPGKISRWIASQ